MRDIIDHCMEAKDRKQLYSWIVVQTPEQLADRFITWILDATKTS